MDSKQKRKDIALICIVIILFIVLVVLVTIGIQGKKKREITTTQPESTVTTAPEDAQSDVGNVVPVKKQGSKYVLDEDKDELDFADGLYKCIIPKYSKSPRWYEFQNGVLDTSFTGLQDSNITDSKGRDRWFFVQNGVVDPNFEGLVSLYPYLRVVQHGEWNQDANGQLYWETDKYNKFRVTDGVVYGVEMGRDDDFFIPQNSKPDGGHYYIVNK